MADAPFAPGEVIMLPDGKVCRVERIGLRATQLYYIDDHAIIYVPNKELANAAIINIFKPSYDLKATLEIGVAYASDIQQVSSVLLEIAQEHPNVLMSDLPRRVQLLEACLARNAAQQERCATLQAVLPKLRHEIALHTHIEALEAKLTELASALRANEHGGLNGKELTTLRAAHLPAMAQTVQNTHTAMQTWLALPDPQALPDEAANDRQRWGEINERLNDKWAGLEKALTKPSADQEMQLDSQTLQLRDWLVTNYKATREPWKDPHVIIKAFGASSIDLQLKYFVDDVRLEHFERPRRIATELMIEIHERFKALNIEIPFQQHDIWVRKS
ncbi:MAG: mechanosensitive ion channel [Anaerolineae bacterium]|nr:mechanosensitive ion channel [Anaerolineae bacterium]